MYNSEKSVCFFAGWLRKTQKVCKGTISIPNLSEENEADEVDVSLLLEFSFFALTTDGSTGRKLSTVILYQYFTSEMVLQIVKPCYLFADSSVI